MIKIFNNNSKEKKNELSQNKLKNTYKNTNLSKVTVLNLSAKNWIKINTNTFESFKELTWLDLGGNLIAEIESRAFKGLSNLKHLDLSKNQLSEISSETFLSLAKLETLSLADNQIKSINFERLPNLKQLDLSGNKLTEIYNNTFEKLNKLEILNLANNRIELIRPTAFAALSDLKQLYLNENLLKLFDPSCFKCLASSIGEILLHKNSFAAGSFKFNFFNQQVFNDWNPDHKFSLCCFKSESISKKFLKIFEYQVFLLEKILYTSEFNVFLRQSDDEPSKIFFSVLLSKL